MRNCNRCNQIKEDARFDKYHPTICTSCTTVNKYKWRDLHKAKHNYVNRRCRLKKKYGCTLEQYEELYKQQKGKCKICFSDKEKVLSVDHDHETGKIRGLLCKQCNRGLGVFKDSLSLLHNAIDYLLS